MGVYDPLNHYLSSSEENIITMTFSAIENLLDRPLPKSAYKYNAWWANNSCSGSPYPHFHASSWLDAGYKVSKLDMHSRKVSFVKDTVTLPNNVPTQKRRMSEYEQLPSFVNAEADITEVCGYPFTFLQNLIPDSDTNGDIIKFYPQNDYDNRKGLSLNPYGQGAFCRFRITAEDCSGVYLWITDGEIIYIGETAALRRRFNSDYGNISPRKCYVGGQSTNCKMNKVVLDYYDQGKTVSLYFYQTPHYKQVESELLMKINTIFNVKGNSLVSKIKI